MSYGITTACGEACDVLIKRVKGERRHLFLIEVVACGSRKEAFEKLKYTAERKRQGAWEILADPYVKASYDVHLQAQQQAAVDWGEELRGMERVSSEAKIAAVSTLKKSDPAAIDHLRQIVEKGIEDREAPGGWRPATDQELVRAAERMSKRDILPTAEWPQTELDSLVDWRLEKDGQWTPIFDVAGARARSAKLEGLNRDSLKISFGDQDTLTANLGRAWGAVVKEHIQDLVEDPDAWLTEVVLGVKKRLGG